LQQTYKDFELIVVDDGSTDETPNILDAYQKQIVYLRKEHAGVSAARNFGIKKACGEYIALLDSDDRWLPHKLEQHLSYVQQHPDIRIHQSEEVWVRKGKRVNPKKKHAKREGYIFIPSLELCLISPSAVVIHADIFKEYGLFDEQMPACEDYDLWLRITRNEYVGLLSESLVVKYGGHEDQLSCREWGMDRFRVYAMLKLYYNSLPELRPEQRISLEKSILKKCQILLLGAEKRGNIVLCHLLQSIIRDLSTQNSSKIDCAALLQG
jgi:glycosyltransferase involved in cell wall biosynthesis